MLCLLLVGRKIKKKKKRIFPRAGHALLAVQHRIFAVVEDN
jgi:hypothetical protein